MKYLPIPYPDELLYSFLARCHLRSGNTSPKATMNELFGSKNSSAIVDMPCNIDILAEKMSFDVNKKSEELILHNTLYPYYTAFLPEDRQQAVLKSMKGSYGGDIHMTSGIVASTVRVPDYFRFCHECKREDIENYGEMYWHRLHQVPGIIVCPKHKLALNESSIAIRGLNKHEYIASDESFCKAHVNSFILPCQLLSSNKACTINQCAYTALVTVFQFCR